MCFQLTQMDAHVSTMAEYTRMVRPSELAVNISAVALMVQSAVPHCVPTSYRRPLLPAHTHNWPGFLDSAVSAWTATREPGISHLSIRYALHWFSMIKDFCPVQDPTQLWSCHWKAKPEKASQLILSHTLGTSDTTDAQASDPAAGKRAGQQPHGSQIQWLGERTRI